MAWHPDLYDSPWLYVAVKYHLTHTVFYELLYGAAQRACPELYVIAFASEEIL